MKFIEINKDSVRLTGNYRFPYSCYYHNRSIYFSRIYRLPNGQGIQYKSIVKLKLFSFDVSFPKIINQHHKWWCNDVKMWEEKFSLFGIPFYRYTIRNGAELTVKYALSSKSVDYIKRPTETNVVIGEKEMKDTYRHKWLVPMNVIYNPKIP